METNVNIIAKSLFATNSFSEVTEEQLSAYTQQFPYTGIGHYLLAKKKKDKGEPFQESAAKAFLYFNNPLWLGYLLGEYKEVAEVPEVPEVPEVAEVAEVPEVVEVPLEVAKGTEGVETIYADNSDTNTAETAIDTTITITSPDSAADVTTDTTVDTTTATPTEAKTTLPAVASGTISATLSEEPLFEPYHTIDYFASQGIRLKLEDLEKDKFGKQLRSFTDWLRAMKKITPVATVAGVGTETVQDPSEAEIQKDAAESVESSEVETEAMAEVWVKQGKKARAAAIYRKLSLLNPAKSHYFAAKIDQLND